MVLVAPEDESSTKHPSVDQTPCVVSLHEEEDDWQFYIFGSTLEWRQPPLLFFINTYYSL